MPRLLRRLRISLALFVLAVSVLGGGTLIGATGAGAGPALSTSSDFLYTGANPCTEEALWGTGTLHLLQSENLSTSGTIQFHLNARLDGLKAVTPSGKKYVVQETFNREFVLSRAAEETFDITAHYVRVGEDGSFVLGDDFYAYLRTHITANANGVITAFRVDMQEPEETCQ